MQRIGRLAVVGALGLAALGAALAGCQRHQGPRASPAPPNAVTVTPDASGVESVVVAEAGPGTYRFVPSEITLRTGKIRITFQNTDRSPHNLTFSTLMQDGHRVAVPTLSGGGEESVDFTVSTPGEYEFVCTLHERLGQVGTLTVKR